MSQHIVVPPLPWSVKGVSQEARAIAKNQAARSGMTMGAWVGYAIRKTAAELGASSSYPISATPAKPNLSESSASVVPQENPLNELPDNPFARLEERLAAISDRLDRMEDRLNSNFVVSEPVRYQTPSLTGSNDSFPPYPRRILS